MAGLSVEIVSRMFHGVPAGASGSAVAAKRARLRVRENKKKIYRRDPKKKNLVGNFVQKKRGVSIEYAPRTILMISITYL